MEVVMLFYVVLYSMIKWMFFDGEREKLSEIPNVQDDYLLGKWVIVLISLLSFLVLAIIPSNDFLFYWFFIIMYTMVLGYQTFMEWKYLKDSKEYLCSLIFLLLGLVSLSLWL